MPMEGDGGSGSTNGEQSSQAPRSLLKTFYFLQTERVQTYALFEEGFQAYLKGAPQYNFQTYRQLVNEITEVFQKISQDVILAKNSLANDCNLNQVANIIDQIQGKEQQKLELTASLQIAQQNYVDDPSQQQYSDEIVDLKNRLKESMKKITEYLEELKYETEDLYTEDD